MTGEEKVGDRIRSPPASASFGRVLQPQNTVKVIKGEIHNVLNVMRADARYASPQRFVRELPLDEHPLLLQLRELHEKLSLLEYRQEKPDLVWYITPFCTAISGRDISASITGAALSALQKFLLYGFITPETEGASEGMTLVAKSILHCTFEESSTRTSKSSNMSRVVTRVQDEEVVLKLLSLSALVVRCSLFKAGEPPLLDATLLLGLLDTCLHVSHRAQEASALLRSAAGDALGQIVLSIFGTRDDEGGQQHTREEDVSVLISRSAILSKLASLVNPLEYSDATCVTSLTLINIALETMRHVPSAAEIAILQNDLCKHLLQWCTTTDLVILSLTLRVIFNLFQSIRDHLKVPLEVFLTSVHLRILDPSSSNSNEQREVVLESLLEFCAEPALMQDLYRNYDCDVHCTNLFETICTTLARISELAGDEVSLPETETASTKPPLNALNRLAIEGILAVIDSIARRCQGHGGMFRRSASPSSSSMMSDVSDTESDNSSVNIGDAISDGLGEGWKAASSEEAQIVLQQRKRKKYWLGQVASEFNRRPMGKEWMQVAERGNVLQSSADPKAVASFLYTTPHLDKTQMGIFLSKGPASKYPFHADVRDCFVSLFDFRGMSFSKALRKFLLRFRLPGEAQCIDRLMEAFSARLYEQHQTSPEVNSGEASKLTPDEEVDLMPFRSADAVFVLSFSTIMLNTDLHNPTIKDERRMTVEQFIRNNRGINDGEDLPAEFLTELYQQIQQDEIQVQTELSDVVRHHSIDGGEFPSFHWDGLLSKSDKVTKPFFTPADEARRTVFQAGVHERDMFLVISQSSIQCISSVFVRSHDDVLVVKALKGLKQMAKVCVFFSMDDTLNQILQLLLGHGRDYIMGCIVLEYSGWTDGTVVSGANAATSDEGEELSDSEYEYEDPRLDSGTPVPQSLVVSNSSASDNDVVYHPAHPELVGSASHRGLLALDLSFKLIRKNTSKIREAWPALIECLCALRDARALPVGLADLDDFADSNGQILPLSPYARQSQALLDEYYLSLSGRDDANEQSWFKISSFFRKEPDLSPMEEFATERASMVEGSAEGLPDLNLSVSGWLLSVAEAADLKQVVLMRANQLPLAKQTIRALLDAIDFEACADDPLFEQHAVFSLELAARAFFSNRDRALDLFPMFLSKFEALLGESDNVPGVQDGSLNITSPFLRERVVVTILRSCIHLYDISEMRPLLRTSLFLLIGLPAQFTRFISDRISCGMAILLRGSFYLFESANEWNFIGDMLDMLSHFGPGRGFVFDGIASTVEYALPAEIERGQICSDVQRDSPEHLSYDGCIVFCKLLSRFASGTYQNDLSLQAPAVICLEKVYRRMLCTMESQEDCQNHAQEPTSIGPDYGLWESVATAFYCVALSDDQDASQQGCECFQRFLLIRDVEAVPDKNWISVLDVMVSKMPSVSSNNARVNTFSLLGKVLLVTVAHLSHRKENWEKLSDIVNLTAVVIGENLREGRRGTVSPLFERTLQTVTYICNHMVTTEFGGDEGYSQWVSETFLLELEKVGASGGSFKNVAAITKPVTDDRCIKETTLDTIEA